MTPLAEVILSPLLISSHFDCAGRRAVVVVVKAQHGHVSEPPGLREDQAVWRGMSNEETVFYFLASDCAIHFRPN